MTPNLTNTLRFFRTRRTDIVLNRAETIIDDHNGSPDEYERLAMQCDLFFTLDYWLKYYKSTPTFEADQFMRVEPLWLEVVQNLCKAFEVTVNVLPRELETMFGRQLTSHAYQMDIVEQRATYASSRKEIEKYRLRFKNGKIYQYPWFSKAQSLFGPALVLAESRTCEAVVRNAATFGDKTNWGFCVMTMNREIYMARHRLDSNNGIIFKSYKQGLFHSYYLAGEAVQWAGSMLIQRGVLTAICPDSGHYQPGENSTLGVLWALQMFAVDLTGVTVWDFKLKNAIMAKDFIDSKGDWGQMVKQGEKTFNDNVREWIDKQPPEVKNWALRQQAFANKTHADKRDEDHDRLVHFSGSHTVTIPATLGVANVVPSTTTVHNPLYGLSPVNQADENDDPDLYQTD